MKKSKFQYQSNDTEISIHFRRRTKMIYGDKRDFIRAQNAITEALKSGKTETEALQAGLNAILAELKPKQTNRQWLQNLNDEDFAQAVFQSICEIENRLNNEAKRRVPYFSLFNPHLGVYKEIRFREWLNALREDGKNGS